jgi:hypothetical protein
MDSSQNSSMVENPQELLSRLIAQHKAGTLEIGDIIYAHHIDTRGTHGLRSISPGLSNSDIDLHEDGDDCLGYPVVRCVESREFLDR